MYERLSRKVPSLNPTFDIKDPQVRAFCDSLTNAWSLRNGTSGADDLDRFITKGEWNTIARNPNILALASIGQPGASLPDGSGSGGLVALPPIIQNLVEFLASGITLIDFSKVYQTNNELFAAMYALTTEVRLNITNIGAEMQKLEDGITAINTITETSDSKSATTLWALKETVHDPVTGLEQAHAYITEINKMDVSSTSANVQHILAMESAVGKNSADIIEINTTTATSTSAIAKEVHGLHAQADRSSADIAWINTVTASSQSAIANQVATLNATVYSDGANTLPWAIASINEINNVTASSTSASALHLHDTMATVGFKARVFVQSNAPSSDAAYTLKPGDLWINPANNNLMSTWTGSAWVDASDKRISGSMGGVTEEERVRVEQDNVLATAINTVWGVVGNINALVQQGSKVDINPAHGSADNFIQVQVALTDPKTGQIVSAAGRADFDAKVAQDKARAEASYVLQVDARSGDKKAVAGMTLYAEADKNGAISAVAFYSDAFVITSADRNNPNPNAPPLTPFSIYQGQVRIGATYLKDFIQSDSYQQSIAGWKIFQDGRAEFNNTVLLGKLLSGSVFIDVNSGFEMGTIATASWTSSNVGWTGSVNTSGLLRMHGPNFHSSTGMYNRIRQTDTNGRELATTVLFTGVADDRITIWRRSSRRGYWEALTTTTTPGLDYGAGSCGWAGTLPCSFAEYWDFGVTPTDSNMNPSNSGKADLREFCLSVTMANI